LYKHNAIQNFKRVSSSVSELDDSTNKLA